MKIVFATNNHNKLREIQQIVPEYYTIIDLKSIGCTEDIEETEETIEGNALLKASYVYQNYKTSCFADDTGLEVEALNGAPGVYSARYAGEQKSSQDNIDKILSELQGKTNRKAQFKTVIALVLDGKEYLFEGIVKGTITESQSGDKGFGYDPVFLPDGYTQTFAQMDAATKNEISHRGIAVKKLCEFLGSSSL